MKGVDQTDAEGRFELHKRRLRPAHPLCLGGRVHSRQAIVTVAAGETRSTIALSEGTGTYSETVTVTANAFREQRISRRAADTRQCDIQNLRNLLTNDPMPPSGVARSPTTGDDFRTIRRPRESVQPDELHVRPACRRHSC